MPARDGTGPLGRGSQSGRGMGNCSSDKEGSNQFAISGSKRPYGLGRRIWDGTFGRFVGRRRINRSNRK